MVPFFGKAFLAMEFSSLGPVFECLGLLIPWSNFEQSVLPLLLEETFLFFREIGFSLVGGLGPNLNLSSPDRSVVLRCRDEILCSFEETFDLLPRGYPPVFLLVLGVGYLDLLSVWK